MLAQRGLAPALAVETVRALAQPLQLLAQLGQSGAGGKQQLPQIALAGQDRIAAAFHGHRVQREHVGAGAAVDATHGAVQQGFRDRAAVCIAKRIAVLLDPAQLSRTSRQI